MMHENKQLCCTYYFKYLNYCITGQYVVKDTVYNNYKISLVVKHITKTFFYSTVFYLFHIYIYKQNIWYCKIGIKILTIIDKLFTIFILNVTS